jgi:hypothetical protein
MAIRDIIRSFVPNSLLEYRRQRRNTVTYTTWKDAEQAAGMDYEEDTLNRFRVDRTLGLSKKGLQHPALGICAAMVGETFRVTDFGGATGQYGYGVADILGNAIDYTVVETPCLVKWAK